MRPPLMGTIPRRVWPELPAMAVAMSRPRLGSVSVAGERGGQDLCAGGSNVHLVSEQQQLRTSCLVARRPPDEPGPDPHPPHCAVPARRSGARG